MVEPTVLQAKVEAADEIQRTLRDIGEFFIQPAAQRPPAEPDPASRPLAKQPASETNETRSPCVAPGFLPDATWGGRTHASQGKKKPKNPILNIKRP